MLFRHLRGLEGVTRPYSSYVLLVLPVFGFSTFSMGLPAYFGGGNVVLPARGLGALWGRVFKWVVLLLRISGGVGVVERGAMNGRPRAKGNLSAARRPRRHLLVSVVGRGLPGRAPARSIVVPLGLVFCTSYPRLLAS